MERTVRREGRWTRRLGVLCALVLSLALLPLVTESSPLAAAQTDGEPLRVAVIGDSGIRGESRDVLRLIRDQGADLVIHTGDFDYNNNPAGFELMIDSVLGPDFPFFAVVGNHDLDSWPAYQQNFVDRLNDVPDASCTGDYGVNASCTFRGLSFLLSGVGTLGTGHETFLADELSTNEGLWRLCVFHKNMAEMQVGTKADDVGWEAYETCGEHGAIVLTGHEHSYSRTKTLTDMQNQTVDPLWPLADSVRTAPGSSFVVVSGLGGKPIRPQIRCLPATPPYGCKGEWASISTSSNGGDYGALFLDLGVDGDPRKGRGTFIDLSGTIVDSFDMYTENGDDPVTPPPTTYFVVKNAVNIDGTRFANEDIAVTNSTGLSRYFDGSDVGLAGLRIDAFSLLDDGDIVMSFNGSGQLPGLGSAFDDSDLLRFSPTSLGAQTSGTFSLFFDGSDVGLTTNGEDIDAVSVLSDGSLILSTNGRTSAGGITPADEDLFRFDPTSLGTTTSGAFSMYFDGSDAGVTAEDVDAVSVSGDTLSISFATAWSVDSLSGDDEDIANFQATQTGDTTTGLFEPSLRYVGADSGLAGTDIGGIHVP